jgi:hypothetical protein
LYGKEKLWVDLQNCLLFMIRKKKFKILKEKRVINS